MMPNYSPAGIIPIKGSGSRVWDQDGKEYIILEVVLLLIV